MTSVESIGKNLKYGKATTGALQPGRIDIVQMEHYYIFGRL
jgi:hypothetical protein